MGAQAFETEFFRKDGGRVPVLVGAAAFDGRREQSVAFVLDLRDRKQAEAAPTRERAAIPRSASGTCSRHARDDARRADCLDRPRSKPAACRHQRQRRSLPASLDRGTPDLDAARRSVEWIINDCHRAGEVIQRVRALAKRTDIRKVPVHINDLVGEVISLVQREIFNHRVSLRKELTSVYRWSSSIGSSSRGDHQPGDQQHGSDAVGRRSASQLTIRSRRDGDTRC